MIRLQPILESVLFEVGESTSEPYKITKKHDENNFTAYYFVAEDETDGQRVQYQVGIGKTIDKIKKRIDYWVSFGIVTGYSSMEYVDYDITSRTGQTGNLFRVMATVLDCVRKQMKEDTRELGPGSYVKSIEFSPSKESASDNRRLNLYMKYIEKNAPPGSQIEIVRDTVVLELPEPK